MSNKLQKIFTENQKLGTILDQDKILMVKNSTSHNPNKPKKNLQLKKRKKNVFTHKSLKSEWLNKKLNAKESNCFW